MTGVIVFLVTAIILMDNVVYMKDMVQVQKSDLDIMYTDSGNVYYGTYELRESSRRLILTLTYEEFTSKRMYISKIKKW